MHRLEFPYCKRGQAQELGANWTAVKARAKAIMHLSSATVSKVQNRLRSTKVKARDKSIKHQWMQQGYIQHRVKVSASEVHQCLAKKSACNTIGFPNGCSDGPDNFVVFDHWRGLILELVSN